MAPSRSVRVPLGRGSLVADLSAPPHARGIVVFAHGSGSGRTSPRNRYVADALVRGDLATLLLDLLTSEEAEEDERTLRHRFDIPLLAARLVRAVDWLAAEPELQPLKVGLYGASTGGAAALIAASERPTEVRSLVLRGARSDLADAQVPRVQAPVLFLVGSLDAPILQANRRSAALLTAPHRIVSVPGATHLFEEPGALEAVAEETTKWFRATLTAPSTAGT